MAKIHIAAMSRTLCGRQVYKRLQPMVAGWGTLSAVTCQRCRDAMRNETNAEQTSSNAAGVMTYTEISPPLTNKRSRTKFVLRLDLLQSENTDNKCKITHAWTAEQNINARVVKMTITRWRDKRYHWCVLVREPFAGQSALWLGTRSMDGFALTLEHAKVFCDEWALKLVKGEDSTSSDAGEKQ